LSLPQYAGWMDIDCYKRCDNRLMPAALMLVDAQRNMLEGETPVPGAKDVRPALESLLASARAKGSVVIHVQNNGSIGDPDEPETVGWELAFAHVDGEIVVQKSEPNTFGSNPHLAKALREMGVKRLVVAGMQSEFCIKETCLGALLEGFEVVVPMGAHATYGASLSDALELSARIETQMEVAGVQIVDLAVVDL
jgi:nicotinamidase-related amidase